ncbi:hypothetical protein Tco_1234543 [Tanacetum coccineum]
MFEVVDASRRHLLEGEKVKRIGRVDGSWLLDRDRPNCHIEGGYDESKITEHHVTIPETDVAGEFVNGEHLTPKHVIANRKESFKVYKENLVKKIDACWAFIIGSAGIFGVVTSKTKLFDTSKWVQDYMIAYITVGIIAAKISRSIDQTQHFSAIKLCVFSLGFAATGILHFKEPNWEILLCCIRLVIALALRNNSKISLADSFQITYA